MTIPAIVPAEGPDVDVGAVIAPTLIFVPLLVVLGIPDVAEAAASGVVGVKVAAAAELGVNVTAFVGAVSTAVFETGRVFVGMKATGRVDVVACATGVTCTTPLVFAFASSAADHHIR